MDLRHLRYFVAVAEEQSFGRAAARLFIGQSTLSEQIRALEVEVGGPLLVRTSRRVELTETGRLLLPEARRTLLQAEHALRVVRDAANGDLGSVRIGFSGVAALSGFVGDDVDAFRASHPRVEVELVEAAPSALIESLRDGSLDVAYAPGIGDSADIVTRARGVIHPVLATSRAHPFTRSRALRLDDLAGRPLVAFAAEDDGWATALVSGVGGSRIQTASSTLGVLALVSAGAGVAIVPSVLELVAMPGVSYLQLEDAPELAVVLAVRREAPAAVVRELLRISGAVEEPS